MNYFKSLSPKKRIMAEYIIITFSVCLMSLSICFFFNPHTIAPGGTPGMAILLNRLTNVSVSSCSLLANGFLLILATIVLGKSYGLKTLYVVVLTSFYIRIFPSFPLFQNPYTSAVLGSLIAGSGIGITLCCRTSSGGTSIIALILYKLFPRIKLHWYTMMIDGIIVVLTTVFTRKGTIFITSGISVFIIGRLIGLITDRWMPKGD